MTRVSPPAIAPIPFRIVAHGLSALQLAASEPDFVT
jgi:hypothetical protein